MSGGQETFQITIRHRWLQHILFWIAIYFFDVFVFGYDSQKYGLYFKMVLYEMPGQIALAYVMMYVSIPLYFNKQYLLSIASFCATFAITAFSAHALILYGSNFYAPDVELFSVSKLFVRGFYLFANGAIAVIIKFARMWYNNEIRLKEMQSTRLESELKMLRDQVNPHFMFNTLNNLYGLVERNPKHAQEMILGLSRILHYMLHESNTKLVSIRKEISCIEDYIELEKVRYAGNLSVSINRSSETDSLQIVPLVIFPFIENSFKHGVSESVDTAWINIDFSTYRNDFVFKIENARNVSAQVASAPGGLGLSNVRRRLELMYGDDHSLQIIDGHDTYLVILKIRLSKMAQEIKNNHEAALSYS